VAARARLSDRTLGQARGAALPAYDRAQAQAGVVHLGVGAFHRAHQAVYLDQCLAAGDLRWGAVGASLRSPDTRDALAPQDGLYTLAVQGPEGERLQVVGAIKSLLVAPEDPAALLARMADPAVRIVTLTVTEKAYGRDADGNLDLARPDIAWDLANPEAPRSVHGFLAGALDARRRAGAPPFAVLCCDNLPANGETVRRLVLQFAGATDGDLACHIERDVAFPSTMVDRIVPATTDEDRARISAALGLEDAWPVKTEPFMQWVVEENFPQGRPDWEPFGVTVAKSVRPFEEMKLRLLNGAHSGLSYLGLLLGRESVSDAFADQRLRGFVEGLWAEAIPTLPRDAGLDPHDYKKALGQRFANTALVHRTAQIANDGSQKLPQRIVAAARARMEAGGDTTHMALVLAAWTAACEARGKTLPAGHFSDPLDGRLEAIFATGEAAGETVQAVFEAVGFSALAGPAAARLAALAASHLETIRRHGAAAAIDAAKGGEA
jgi:fructuronate reductase